MLRNQIYTRSTKWALLPLELGLKQVPQITTIFTTHETSISECKMPELPILMGKSRGLALMDGFQPQEQPLGIGL